MLDFFERGLEVLRLSCCTGFPQHEEEGLQLVCESGYETSQGNEFVGEALLLFFYFRGKCLQDRLNLI